MKFQMKNIKFVFLVILFNIFYIANAHAEIVDYIAATVDEEVITASELRERLDIITGYYKKIYTAEELQKYLEQAKENVLKETIEEKILLIGAERAEIEISEEEIKKSVEEFKKEFSTDDEFYNQLEKEGFTFDEFKEKTKSRLKIGKFARLNITRDIRITEEEVANFYEENKSSFLMPAQVKISQILIKDLEKNEAEKRIEEIFQKLKDGEDFSLLAKSYSEGPNASSGGDLGFIYLEQLQPQIRQAVSKLKVGEFTKSVFTSMGYHIIKLEAKKLSQYAPISEVSELIKRKIYDLKAAKAYEDWMNNAKKNADIVIHSPF